MKRTNSRFVVARLMLIVLTLAIAVFSLASCEGLPPELQETLGGNPNANCEHVYDNACDTDCNNCDATRTTEHTYANGVCSVCGAVDASVPACEHANVENCVCKDCDEDVHTNFVFVPGKPATCEERGQIDSYACWDCQKGFYDAEATDLLTVDNAMERFFIPQLGHNYVDGVCDRCGHCKHLTVENCVCQDCNKPVHRGILVDYAYIAPTCTENGRIAYLACGDCETILYDAETLAPITDPSEIVISRLGGEHNYVNGVCDKCGDVDESVPTCEHTTVENCVCKDCSAPVHTDIAYIPAFAPECGVFGTRLDVYGCNDCGKGYYDEELKNEIADVTDVFIPALGHKLVGLVCERCGFYLLGGGITNESPDPTPWQSAYIYLSNLYRADNHKATATDYELISKVVIEGEEFAVTWTIANESITLTYDADREVYIVNVPDEVTKDCYYSIVATIYNSETGGSQTYRFVRLLEKNASTHQHPDVENCVCNSCNEAVHNVEFVKAEAPTCENFGNIDFYICIDCNKLFSDAEGKNETTSSVVIPALGGHNYVNGTCDKCGSSDPSAEGAAGGTNTGDHDGHSEP